MLTLPKSNNWHTKRIRSLRYVGSKIRLTSKIADVLKGTGADCVVDVFGGSGAVVANTGFTKRVYNDLDSDIVTFFRVLADDAKRAQLLRMLKNTPMSRQIFDELSTKYVEHGKSFSYLPDVERAHAVFFRSSYAFGGKFKNGGFGASLSDRSGCKEIKRYYGILRDFARLGNFWRGTVIENLPFPKLIKAYEKRPGIVLYCDPPYIGTESYYTHTFPEQSHRDLAEQLTKSPAAAVVSYYDCPLVRELYKKEDGWKFHRITATKNSMGRGSNKKQKVTELLIVKQAR